MKLFDLFLNEAVAVHSESLLAYVITVAEAFHDAPTVEERAVPAYKALAQHVARTVKQVNGKVKVIPSDDPENQPYQVSNTDANINNAGHRDLVHDIAKNKKLSVWTVSGKHPVLSNDENYDFRTVHDYFGHTLPNVKDFSQGKNLRSYGFNVRGELNIFLTQARLMTKAATPALFTEIVGHVCYFFAAGDYGPQKAAILDGFDYSTIGRCSGARQQRMTELLQIIHDPQQQTIPTKIRNVAKNRINWPLLSPSGAARQG